MKNMQMKSALAAILLLGVQLVQAEVTLPAIVSSNMVLQRNTTVALWGWAEAGEEISLEASWLDAALQTRAGEDGTWQLEVPTTESKEAQQIKIIGEGTEVILENILLGEVWLCSGQSNMQQSLLGYTGQPTFGGMEAIATASNPMLRLFSVNREGSKLPQEKLGGHSPWQESSPESAAGFSAVAYFFGQQLQEILDVPVGLIHTSWGGSRVEAWISKEVMEGFREVNLDTVDISHRTNHIPTALYNAMIQPLVPYAIRGATWYQGESNRNEPENYTGLLPAMVEDWRSRWGLGEFPFYYTQIAPYRYEDPDAFDAPGNTAYIREAQLMCLDLIPHSGMAVTMDIGDKTCIHPPKKKEVADRLLYHALSQTYGFPNIDHASPVYESMEVEEGALRLHFRNAENGLFAYAKLEGFEIAGEDRVFYPAEAWIANRRELMVKSEQVAEPVAVRYAWRNWVEGTLFDASLLPASSFRTDQWSDATRAEP